MASLSTPALFALGSSQAFGERIAQHAGLDLLPHEEREFEDGEHKARPLQGVRGRDVYVLHSLYGEHQASVNDKLCRLLFFLGAVRDAGAQRVTAVVPYLAYARKDQKSKPRDPVTTRYVASLFEAVGTDLVLTMDVHNLAAYQNAFRCRTEHLLGAPVLLGALLPLLDNNALAVLAPDTGAVKRADRFRKMLEQASGRECAMAFMEKYRSEGQLTGGRLVGELDGRDVVLLDDLISTGSTVGRALAAAQEAGARRAFVLATHGLLLPGAAQHLNVPILERLLVCDTVRPVHLPESNVRRKLMLVDCAPLFAEAIARLHSNGSLVELEDMPMPVLGRREPAQQQPPPQ